MSINKQKTVRRTRQREALRRVFEEAERPLTPAEARDRIGNRAGIATVYRAVARWADEGWLSAVQLPGEPTRYELRDLEHHHHFHCEQCRRVFDIRGCPSGIGRMAPRGFRVRAHQITFQGICRECAAEAVSVPQRKRRPAVGRAEQKTP